MRFYRIKDVLDYCKNHINDDNYDYKNIIHYISDSHDAVLSIFRWLVQEILDVQNETNSKKGFTKEEWQKRFKNAQTFRRSSEWAKCRILILKRDNYTCQICETSPARVIHHLNSVIVFPEMSLDPDNLITVCDECHKNWHQY